MSAYPSALPPPFRAPPPPPRAGADAAAEDARGLPLETPILIVEDEVMIAWMIESILEDMGFRAIEMASSGSEARQAAAASPPGLVISDINLGEGPDGVETAVAIGGAAAIPVLFVTAYADDATHERIATILPHALVLSKPMQAADLRGALRVLLGRSKAS